MLHFLRESTKYSPFILAKPCIPRRLFWFKIDTDILLEVVTSTHAAEGGVTIVWEGTSIPVYLLVNSGMVKQRLKCNGLFREPKRLNNKRAVFFCTRCSFLAKHPQMNPALTWWSCLVCLIHLPRKYVAIFLFSLSFKWLQTMKHSWKNVNTGTKALVLKG